MKIEKKEKVVTNTKKPESNPDMTSDNIKSNILDIYDTPTSFINKFRGGFPSSLKAEEYIGSYFSLPDIITDITKMSCISNVKVQEPLVFAYEILTKIINHCFVQILKLTNHEERSQPTILQIINQLAERLGIGSLNIVSSNYIASYDIRNIIIMIFNDFHRVGKLEKEKVILVPLYNEWKQNSKQSLFSKVFMGGLSYDPSNTTLKREDMHQLIIPRFFEPISGFINNRINIFSYLNNGFINDSKDFKAHYKGSFNINIYTDFLSSQDFQAHLENNIGNIISRSIFQNFYVPKTDRSSTASNSGVTVDSNSASNTIGEYFENSIYNGMIHIMCNVNGSDLSTTLTKHMGSTVYNPDVSLFKPFIMDKLKDINMFNSIISSQEEKQETNSFGFIEKKLTKQNKEQLIEKCLSYFSISKNITLSEVYKFVVSTIYQYSKNVNQTFDIFLKNFDIIKEYQHSISKRSVSLSHIPLTYNMEDLGGLDIFKQRVKEYKNHIKNLEEHPEYPPRGGAILLGGVPGAGKTLASMYAASYLNRSLYKLDISKMIGSLQGVSEKNMENDLNTIKSMGKVVLLVDEIEKVFGGVASSHQTDGGVLLRLLEKFMAFLAEENPDIFIIMTCNSVTGLPTALMRSGRISNLMFVDFPSKEELIEIINIQAKIELIGRLHLGKKEIEALADMLLKRCNYNGSDIRELFRQTFNYSIGEDGKDPKMEHILRAFMMYKPNAEKLNEGVEQIRNVFLESFEPASSVSDAFAIYKKKFMEKSESMKSNLNSEMKKLFEKEQNAIFSIEEQKSSKADLEI